MWKRGSTARYAQNEKKTLSQFHSAFEKLARDKRNTQWECMQSETDIPIEKSEREQKATKITRHNNKKATTTVAAADAPIIAL